MPTNLPHLNTHQPIVPGVSPFREIYSRSFSRKIDKRSRIGCRSKIAHLLTILRAKTRPIFPVYLVASSSRNLPLYLPSLVLNFAFEINSAKGACVGVTYPKVRIASRPGWCWCWHIETPAIRRREARRKLPSRVFSRDCLSQLEYS